METSIQNVVVTRDGGHDCWDTTITAREIARAFKYGMLDIDPDHQRGKDSITGKYVVKADKVDRWARQLQEDSAIFGQLTWNFRPEEADIEFKADPDNPSHGTLVVRDGAAYLPDSVHRHYAIEKAVESVTAGSSFDPNRRFSLRIWSVPEAFENDIFYAMNMEHDKADATRSKWLAQKNTGQRIAAEVVRRSPHLGEANVETVSNSLSVRNPRLAAFNTLSAGFEDAWADIDPEDLDKAVDWFVGFWDRLVGVLPQLGRLALPQRQKSRKDSLVGWAIAIQGYIRLARRFYDEALDLTLLDRLAEKHADEEGTWEFFTWENPVFQRKGIVVPAVTKSGQTRLTARNSHQTRRAMAEALAEHIGLPKKTAAQDTLL
jgi:DNA-sulfur modification-associated